MAEVVFIGGAPAVAQINTETPANVEISDIFTILLENSGGDRHTISFTATAATVKNCVEGLVAAAVAAAAAGTAPWDEVTCTEDDLKVTITADTAGVPFWVTATATDGGVADTQTLTDANSTAVAGPGILSTAENYKGDAIPVNGDSLTFAPSITATIYGYDMSAVTLIGLKVSEGVNVAMGGKGRSLQFGLKHSAAYYNADLSGTGTSYIQIDDYHVINVHRAGPPTDSVPWALNLVGDHDADDTGGRGTVNIKAGRNESVSIGANPGEDMEVNKVVVSGEATVEVGASVTENDDATAPDIEIMAGEVSTRCPLGTATLTGGKMYHEEGVLATAKVQAGLLYYRATATLSALTVDDAGTWDCSEVIMARTVTACSRHGEGTIKDPHKTVTWTGGIDLQECGVDANLQIGEHFTLNMGTI